MKILSWNVNGIRAVIKKGFLDFLKKEEPDVLCLQEIKINDAAILKEKFDFPEYEEYWNSAERPGYSGTAILVKSSEVYKVKSFNDSIGVKEFDQEGRTQTLEFEKYYLVNAYFPNANHELSRLDYKLRFDQALLKHCQKLENPSTGSGQAKPVIICGDFNVAHEEIDLARPKDNVGNPGFTDEERAWMTKFLTKGFVDTFRSLHPDKVGYSWWSYRFNARPRNIGWRIDYFCVSAKLFKYIKKAFILNQVTGSDHCPVGIEINH